MTRRTWSFVILAAILVASATLVYQYRSQETTGETPTVRVGYLPHHGFLPLFVALDRGFFEQRGITVDPVRFESSPPMGTAFVNGEIACVPISTSVALSIESRDPGRFKIAAVSSESRLGYLTAMLAMPDSGIGRVEDLRGKKLGCFPGPASLTLFGMVVQKHGIQPDTDVTMVEIPPPLHVQALATGQVDALATYEPMASQAVAEHGAIMFFPAAVETDVLEPTQGGVWLVSAELLRDSPDTARKYVLALYDAIDFIRSKASVAKESISNYTAVSPTIISRLPLIPYSKVGEIDLGALQQYADIMTDHRVLSRRISVEPLVLDPALIQP